MWTTHRSGCTLRAVHSIRLRISALADVTGYTRFQIRGLLSEVFRDSGLGKRAGAQQTFSPQDLLVVAVACDIEGKFGVARKRMALIGEMLRLTLTGPRRANRDARLLVAFSPPAVTYLDADECVREGLVIALRDQFAKVDEYLGVSGEHKGHTEATVPLRSAPGAHSR